jgi:hypothetical protein
MKKLLGMLLIVLATAASLPAALHVYQVPDLAGGNESPSIARNSLGDILIVYRNNVGGAAYYFKKHDGSTLGPAIIPGQTYELFAKQNILFTDIVATPDNNFHSTWNFDIHAGAWGLYYAIFDITSEQWTTPSQILTGKIEGPKLTINPLTNDLILVYDNYQGSINKDVFIKVKTAQGWQKEVDISLSTQETTNKAGFAGRLSEATGESAGTRIQAPHGNLAETNPWVAVDETDGYVYMTWKADKWNETTSSWELLIVVALLDPGYKRVWYGRVTRNYDGFHVLPSIAAMDGKAMMTFAWQQEAGYYYLNFVRNGNSLTYDPTTLYTHRIAQAPLMPHWNFFSAIMQHGDSLAFTYKDYNKAVKLLHYTIDGHRLDSTPIDLCNQEESRWPYDSYSSPEVGILTVWSTPRQGDASIHYSIYDDPRSVVGSPLNLRVETKMERSFFKSYYLNSLTWEANPYNTVHNVTLSAQRVYRKLKTQDRSQYVRIAEVSASALSYADSANVGAVNLYDYAVTCVDNEGHESTIR